MPREATLLRQISNAETWAREADANGRTAMAAYWRNAAAMLRDEMGRDGDPAVPA